MDRTMNHKLYNRSNRGSNRGGGVVEIMAVMVMVVVTVYHASNYNDTGDYLR